MEEERRRRRGEEEEHGVELTKVVERDVELLDMYEH